jgi:hypothetical protein
VNKLFLSKECVSSKDGYFSGRQSAKEALDRCLVRHPGSLAHSVVRMSLTALGLMTLASQHHLHISRNGAVWRLFLPLRESLYGTCDAELYHLSRYEEPKGSAKEWLATGIPAQSKLLALDSS